MRTVLFFKIDENIPIAAEIFIQLARFSMLPKKYQKRSFLRFDCNLDNDSLVDEFRSIKDNAWETSYWGSIHCSIGMLLLRGGNQGTEFDFFCDHVVDKPILKDMPYIASLIDENGPFGRAHYAFIFKLKPHGVTLRHQDTIEKWFDMYRIHIPIITNPGAHLIANEKSQHFAAGYAWSFDNQADHGVVNGDEERIHLIFDVPFSEKMARRIDTAEYLTGERVNSHVNKISRIDRAVASYPGDELMINGIRNLRAQGASSTQIAEFINSKGIPSKSYPVTPWDKKMVDKLA